MQYHQSYRTKQPLRRHSNILIFVVIGTLLTYTLAAVIWPVPKTTALGAAPVVTTPAAAHLAWPSYGQSALAAEGYGASLGTSGEQTPVPMASITKIVTALVVLEKKPITNGTGETISFTANDITIYNEQLAQDGMVLPVSTSMSLTQYQVLQGMLVHSANNYAESLAVWAYGSMPTYLTAANAYLDEHGLAQTTVMDASGISTDSKSSATDLVKLGQLALANNVVADIVSQKTATIPGIGTIYSTNLLLGTNDVIGIKTGTTDEAGACLLYAVQIAVGSKTITVVGATLGAPNHSTLARDLTDLINTTKAGFHEITVATHGDSFATYTTPWGVSTEAVSTDNASLVTWSDVPITATVHTKAIANGSAGSPAGNVTFTSNEQSIETSLTLATDLHKPSLWWRLTHPFALFSP